MAISTRAPSAIPKWFDLCWPAEFSIARQSRTSEIYLKDPAARKLVEFFEKKGLAALREEERREEWYADWLAYQAEHRIYASVLSPKGYSSLGHQFDILRYARLLEVFAYFSAGHGYSLQVSFLGLFSILMGSNVELKREAVAALEAGGQFAFGVSEKGHGSDLFGNAFLIREIEPGCFVANGSKYYIGNANCASIISILSRKERRNGDGRPEKRSPFVLFALRPGESKGFGNLRKIHTFGVRAAFVGAFDVKDHLFGESDIFAEGRTAWDAIFGAVTLGKFFLGFGSIGICEHAWSEAVTYLNRRVLYGKAVLEMPHVRGIAAEATARLTAMKLFAYRALDYVQAASAKDRRYLLLCAVQKAKVSTEGVKVMSLLSECVGAKGFESADTYFEMARRDVQLIPLLESSAHINLAFAAQFIPAYFGAGNGGLGQPGSLVGGAESAENPYLFEARSTAINAIAFPDYLRAYKPLMSVENVRLFAAQAEAFARFAERIRAGRKSQDGISLVLGECISTIVYGELIAESAKILGVEREMISAMFHVLVSDLSVSALALAALPGVDAESGSSMRELIAVPKTAAGDWEFVSSRVANLGR